LDWALSAHDCDSELGKLFDGRLRSKDFTTAYVAGSGERRGTHTASYAWTSSAGLVRGRLQGMTNEGTHREPPFKGCQRCDDRGVMEGRLTGKVTQASDPRLVGAQVVAAYRMNFDPSEDGGEGAVTGTVEGLVVRPCKRVQDCVEFATVDTDTNPRSAGAFTIETRDLNGPTADTQVVDWGGLTGLHLWHSSTLTFAPPVQAVDITLITFAQPATATALDAAKAPLSTATMTAPQRVPETLHLSGPGIAFVEVDSPADEVLMPKVCWEA
jgi:hypothetical protein